MIHQLIFAYPRPGMTEREFHRYWLDVHAVRYASRIPQIKRYAVDTRVELPDDEGEPTWCGAAEIWLPDGEAQLASLQTPEFLDGARMDEPRWAAFWRTLALDTDPTVLVEGPPPQRRDRAVKLFVLVKRREGMGLPEFRRYSLSTHAPRAGAVPGLRRYVVGHTVNGAYGIGEAPLDGVHQMWFDDVEALVAARRSPAFQAFTDVLGEYTDPRWVHTFAAEQHWIVGPEARP